MNPYAKRRKNKLHRARRRAAKLAWPVAWVNVRRMFNLYASPGCIYPWYEAELRLVRKGLPIDR